jgi:hypothetical protein
VDPKVKAERQLLVPLKNVDLKARIDSGVATVDV